MKKKRIALSSLVFILLTASCFLQKKEQPVNLDIFSGIGSGIEWAVINDPYAAFYTEPSKTSAIKSHGRRADVLEVKGKRIITDSQQHVLWYEFEKGWLESGSVTVYANKIQAEHASEKALQ